MRTETKLFIQKQIIIIFADDEFIIKIHFYVIF